MTYIHPLAALADPTRRLLYARLRRRPHAVGELAKMLKITQPAVSQHLSVLRKARLVQSRAEGTKRWYQPDPKGLARLRADVDKMWSDVLGAYAASFEDIQ
jgi:DNA-binding transcriptional ArsR family regulator